MEFETIAAIFSIIASGFAIYAAWQANNKVDTFIKNQNKTNQKNKEGDNISQNHSGSGDNVGRDKNGK